MVVPEGFDPSAFHLGGDYIDLQFIMIFNEPYVLLWF